MLYIYNCIKGHEFEVVKSVKDIDNVEKCPDCATLDTKRIICCRGGFYGEKEWDSYSYNVGLGQVTRNSKHRAQIAKRMNLEEIGNQDVETMHKSNEADRIKMHKSSWDKV